MGTRRVHGPAFGQSAEGGRAHIRIRAVVQVIEKVQQDDRVPVLTADLEDPLHRVAPAAQHLAVSRGQVRSAGQEPVQHGLAVRQAVLKREPVDDANRFALAQFSFGACGLQHEECQMPFEPRPAGEVDQGPLQFRAAPDEEGDRCLVAAIVHPPLVFLVPRPLRALVRQRRQRQVSGLTFLYTVRARSSAAPGRPNRTSSMSSSVLELSFEISRRFISPRSASDMPQRSPRGRRCGGRGSAGGVGLADQADAPGHWRCSPGRSPGVALVEVLDLAGADGEGRS